MLKKYSILGDYVGALSELEVTPGKDIYIVTRRRLGIHMAKVRVGPKETLPGKGNGV
jgi:hypothetical protein